MIHFRSFFQQLSFSFSRGRTKKYNCNIHFLIGCRFYFVSSKFGVMELTFGHKTRADDSHATLLCVKLFINNFKKYLYYISVQGGKIFRGSSNTSNVNTHAPPLGKDSRQTL